MPVLPTIPENVKFQPTPSVRYEDKIVDRPNAFGKICHSLNHKRHLAAARPHSMTASSIPPAGATTASTARSASIHASNDTKSVSVNNNNTLSLRFRHKPAPTDPILCIGGKEFIPTMRGRVAHQTASSEFQDPYANHPRRRHIAFETVHHYTHHPSSNAAATTQHSSSTARTTDSYPYKGKRQLPSAHSPTRDDASLRRIENLRTTSRYLNSHRFDTPSMMDPTFTNNGTADNNNIKVITTGREMFKRSATSLEGVFYPLKNPGSRASSQVRPPPYWVD